MLNEDIQLLNSAMDDITRYIKSASKFLTVAHADKLKPVSLYPADTSQNSILHALFKNIHNFKTMHRLSMLILDELNANPPSIWSSIDLIETVRGDFSKSFNEMKLRCSKLRGLDPVSNITYKLDTMDKLRYAQVLFRVWTNAIDLYVKLLSESPLSNEVQEIISEDKTYIIGKDKIHPLLQRHRMRYTDPFPITDRGKTDTETFLKLSTLNKVAYVLVYSVVPNPIRFNTQQLIGTEKITTSITPEIIDKYTPCNILPDVDRYDLRVEKVGKGASTVYVETIDGTNWFKLIPDKTILNTEDSVSTYQKMVEYTEKGRVKPKSHISEMNVVRIREIMYNEMFDTLVEMGRHINAGKKAVIDRIIASAIENTVKEVYANIDHPELRFTLRHLIRRVIQQFKREYTSQYENTKSIERTLVQALFSAIPPKDNMFMKLEEKIKLINISEHE